MSETLGNLGMLMYHDAWSGDVICICFVTGPISRSCHDAPHPPYCLWFVGCDMNSVSSASEAMARTHGTEICRGCLPSHFDL